MKGEINLLPEKLQTNRRRRVLLLGVGRFLSRLYILLILLVVAEVGIYVALQSEKKLVSEGVNNEDESSLVAVDEISRVNRLLGAIEIKLGGFTAWSLLVEDVLRVAPGEVFISLVEVDEDEESLDIKGGSSSREAVVEFQQLLEGLEWVQKVEAPLQNFALGPETEFLFTLYKKGSAL